MYYVLETMGRQTELAGVGAVPRYYIVYISTSATVCACDCGPTY